MSDLPAFADVDVALVDGIIQLLGDGGTLIANLPGDRPAILRDGLNDAMAERDRPARQGTDIPVEAALENPGIDEERAARLAETIRVGMQVARQMNREELERQFRCVQIYGYGYLLNHGGEQIALDPKDVTVVLPASRHLDDFDLHNSLHLTEQKLAAARERINELEDAVESNALGHVLDEVTRERDEARQRIQSVLDYLSKIECLNCEHVHQPGFELCGAAPTAVDRPCWCDWGPGPVAEDVRDLLKEKK